MDPSIEAEAVADDPRLLKAAQEYLAELEAGRRPNRLAFLDLAGEMADKLAPFLDAIDMVHGAYSSAPNAPALPPKGAAPIEPLGDFRIVREIGRGGMGIVYEAVQMSLGRRVALKVLPFAAALDAKQLQRFRNEAQAAAQLHHSNIVPVYAVGCERGVHYYAMQMIEGQNLADLIAEMRAWDRDHRAPLPARPPSKPRSSATTNIHALQAAQATMAPAATARPATQGTSSTASAMACALSTQRAGRSPNYYQTCARLTAQAALGLEHAHQFGVLHRDVKPANLIVDGRGTVWITDFGLAQFHSGQAITRTGDLMGTIRYMSPEQAGGNHAALDPRTDVYSLGATLYELLTLEPLFDGTNHIYLLGQVLHQEPRAPRAVNRDIPAELETIVLKAVSKNPADRYATAQEFSDDLNRFLENKPIVARRPTIMQRARKWTQRHPGAVVAAAAILVLISVVSLVSASLILAEKENTDAARKRAEAQEQKARDEEQKAKNALALEQQLRQEADQRFQLALRSVDEMVDISDEAFGLDPSLQLIRKRLLYSALEAYQELIDKRKDDPQMQATLAAHQTRVQQILDDLEETRRSIQLSMLFSQDVVNDLHMSDDQQTKLAAVRKTHEDKRRELFKAWNDERRKHGGDQRFPWDEQRRAEAAEIGKLLTDQQIRRLDQISLQLLGIHALRDPKVAADLGLTSAQRKEIRAIVAETPLFPTGMPTGGFGRGGPGGHRGGRGPGQEGDRGPKDGRSGPPDGGPRDRGSHPQPPPHANSEKVHELLTDDQWQLWQKMIGEPFKGEAWRFEFPPPQKPPGTD